MEKDRAADGLRGIAAMNVVLCHFFISFFPLGFADIYPGAASSEAAPHALDALISAPLLSVFWNGNFAVCVFFVLSGYVLTKAFVETGSTSSLKLRAARRYFRLGIPILGSVLLAYIVLATGIKRSDQLAAVTHSAWLKQFWNFTPQLSDMLKEGSYRAILFGQSKLVPILWTMRVEFIGSMIVFGYRALQLPGSAGTIATVTFALVLVGFFPHEGVFYLGFLAGSLLGQVAPPKGRKIQAIMLAVAWVGGAFDLSWRYRWLDWLHLPTHDLKNICNTIGAIALLYAVRAGAFKPILTSRPAQYLGRVSYAVYLVHFPILLSFSSWLFLALNRRHAGPYTALVLLDLLMTATVVLIVATMFEATFDRMGIALSRRVFPSRLVQGDSNVTAPIP